MASQQLEEIIQELRSGPAWADLSVEEQRAGMDEVASQFPLAAEVK